MANEERIESHEENLPPESAVNHGGVPSPPRAEAPPQAAVLNIPTLAISSVLALIFGMMGASVSAHYLARKRPEPGAGSLPTATATGTDNTALPAPKPSPIAEPPAPTASAATPEDTAEVRKRIDQLSNRLDSLAKQVEAISGKRELASDSNLTTLQLKVADLAKSEKDMAQVPVDLKRIDGRVENMHSQLRSLREELDAIESRFEQATVRPVLPTRPVSSIEPPASERHDAAKPVADLADTNSVSHALDAGAALFKKGQYKDALEAFGQLELSRPEDARVWYYAALCRGLSTNEWSDGTVNLVERGIERERSGTPDPKTIDAEFRGLTRETGKDWLAAYRARAKAKTTATIAP